MKLKTYRARNLKEALAQVKKDLGPEAVILSTQSRRTLGPEAGWPRIEVEVTAALDDQSPAHGENVTTAIPDDSPRPKSLLHQFQDDLQELKELFAGWLHHHGPPAWLMPYREMVTLYQDLLKKGVAPQIVQRWLAQVQALVKPQKPPHALKNDALAHLMEAFEVMDPWHAPHKGPRCWTFLGPTGVGKTTTIAKLAVHFRVAMKKSVGLLSLDGHRPGGHELLAIYARFIGVSFAAVNRRQDLVDMLNRWQDREIVLIDTPGQSPAACEVPGSLIGFVRNMPGLERHLVLSATSSEASLAAALRDYNSPPLNSIIITKVDESRDISGLFNQLCRHCLPVSYLTAGQRIPEDIEPASRQRLVELLLEHPREIVGSAASWEKYEQVVGA